jgi:hypothetical protein
LNGAPARRTLNPERAPSSAATKSVKLMLASICSPRQAKPPVAAKLREEGGAQVGVLTRLVLLCYYRDDRVMRSLGQEPRPPMNQSFRRAAVGIPGFCAFFNMYGPQSLLPSLAQEGLSVAFVFGGERFGLSNDDVYRCHLCLSVPTAEDFGSLNLAQAAQLIAYELPLVLAAAAIVMQAGTLSLVGIVEAQRSMWNIVRPWQLVGFLVFVVASLAELTRPPFDMPVADSEIIFGAYTEYTGLKFAFFLLAEYGGIVALAGIAATLYLGGYLGLPGIPLPPPVWMLGKIIALSFVVIWLRATYPRLREDQLQRFSWLALIPLSLVMIMVVAVVKVATK